MQKELSSDSSSSSSSDSSSSSESEDEFFKKCLKHKSRLHPQRENLLLKYNDSEFQKLFRIPKQWAANISDKISFAIGGFGLKPIECTLVALRFFATGSLLQVIHDCYNIEEQLAKDIVMGVCRSIAELSHIAIQMPQMPKKLPEILQSHETFKRNYELDNVLGIIKNVHIPVKGATAEDEKYLNSNKWHSINLQLIIDHRMNIRNFSCIPGSTDNETVFMKSSICKDFNDQNPSDSVFLSDDSHSCRKFVLTPVQNPTKLNEKFYNKNLDLACSIGKEAVARLVERFPVLKLKTALNIESSLIVMEALLVLHNSLKNFTIPESNIYSIYKQPIALPCTTDIDCSRRDIAIN